MVCHGPVAAGGVPGPRTERQIDSFPDEVPLAPDLIEVIPMPDVLTDLVRPVPSIVPHDTPAMSDDECLVRLARALSDHDPDDLDEVARLIARLAVTIE
jgi:hypothetical protein